ncbi:MAG TPA: ATP-dependent protease subunit HslV [Chloroflexota bacterium]|jgi:ATP-dependent HslUV protease subunit HslV|nr:ATP-dependent protease subunit HslV [Chloroflexota bacterium]
MERLRSTTILAIARDGVAAMAGDGQVTQGDVVMKHTARKIQRLYHKRVLVGFAGSAADGITLLERLDAQLEQTGGQLRKAAVELAKDWRTDKYLRRLEAQVIAATPDELLVISGDGDVIQPDEGFVAIGSGGPYAYAAAQALVRHTALDARTIARSALEIAAAICIYTNDRIVVESLPE